MNLNLLRTKFPELVFEVDENMAAYTYMKVGGNASALVDVKSKNDLFALSAFCFTEKIPFVVIGGGSNTIVRDEGIDKLVIHNLTSEIVVNPKNETLVEVEVDSGVITAVLAAKTIALNLTGFEYFVGVPGTIGGAIVNNSHFSASDLVGNNVLSVDVVTSAGKMETWDVTKLQFAYDYSIFHENPAVVLSARFWFRRVDALLIAEHVKKAAQKRTSTQPIGIPSSGCMFKNPQIPTSKFQQLETVFDIPQGAYKDLGNNKYQIAAGYLIDQAGLKGVSVGGAQVSERHATYIINMGNATASDVESLCEQVESVVSAKYGIKLEREVFFLSR